MTINTNPAGRLAEFLKTTRKDTSADILVNSGIKKIKTDNDNVEMVALYRASSSTSKFAMIKNAFLGRTPADRSDVLTLLKAAGMNDDQADSAVENIAFVRGHYSAKSVRETIDKFKSDNIKGTATILENTESNPATTRS